MPLDWLPKSWVDETDLWGYTNRVKSGLGSLMEAAKPILQPEPLSMPEPMPEPQPIEAPEPEPFTPFTLPDLTSVLPGLTREKEAAARAAEQTRQQQAAPPAGPAPFSLPDLSTIIPGFTPSAGRPTAGEPGGPPLASTHPVLETPRSAAPAQTGDLRAYTRAKAASLGIDPNVAERVFGEGEGGFDNPVRQSEVVYQGRREESYGPAQLNVEGGLGTEAIRRGIDPRKPEDVYRGIDFALEHAARNGWGAFHGAKRIGIGERDGIGTVPTGPAPTAPRPGAMPAEQTPEAQAQAFAAGSWTPNQINAATGEGLDYETALAVCGPAAAIAFARKNGRNPTMSEALGLAKQVGWTVEQGMAGPQSQQRLLSSMGVAARLVDGAPDWQSVAADVQRGNPVIISTPGHYFVAERYNPEDGTFDFGESAAVLKASGGRRWFRPEELASLGMGEARASLFMDSPQSPAPSVVAGRAAPTAGAPPASAAPPPPAAAAPPPQPVAGGTPLDDARTAPWQASGGDMQRMSLDEQPADQPPDAEAMPYPRYNRLNVRTRPDGSVIDALDDENFQTPRGARLDLNTPSGADLDPVQTWYPPGTPNQAVPGTVDEYTVPPGMEEVDREVYEREQRDRLDRRTDRLIRDEIQYRAPLGDTAPVRDRWADEPEAPLDPNPEVMSPDLPIPDTYSVDPDTGPREAVPGSVGSTPYLGPLSPEPEMVTPSAPPAYDTQATSGGPFPAEQYTEVETRPTAQPAPVAEERYLDQSLPSPPGWQAIVDGAGNVVDWVRERAQEASTAIREDARQGAARAIEAPLDPDTGLPMEPPGSPYAPGQVEATTPPPAHQMRPGGRTVVQATDGEPDYVPRPPSVFGEGGLLEPLAGGPRIVERMSQIRQNAARELGRSAADLRVTNDPGWRQRNPQAAEEYDDLQRQLDLSLLGQVGDAGRMPRWRVRAPDGTVLHQAATPEQATAWMQRNSPDATIVPPAPDAAAVPSLGQRVAAPFERGGAFGTPRTPATPELNPEWVAAQRAENAGRAALPAPESVPTPQRPATNAERVAALDARAAEQGSTTTAGVVGPSPGVQSSQQGAPLPSAAPSRAAEAVEAVRTANLVTPERMVSLIGDRPEYLADVAQHILEQRRKVREGRLTVRDTAKAYYMTVASQGSDAIDVDIVRAKTGFEVPERFWSAERSANGRPTVRPEEAAAAWLFSPKGQQALDDLERGVMNREAWAEGAAIRRAFGDDRFRTNNVFSERAPVNGRTQFNMDSIQAFTDRFNEVAQTGNVAQVQSLLKRLNGISEAKGPFIGHTLGFGESPTIDAVEITAWLTGRGDFAGRRGPEFDLRRQIDRALMDKRVGRALSERITDQIAQMRQHLPPEATADLPDEVFNHVLHHWIWDRMKGTATTHEGFYDALRNAALLGPSPGPRGASVGTQLATDLGNSVLGAGAGATYSVATGDEENLGRNVLAGALGYPALGRGMRRAGGALGTVGPVGSRSATDQPAPPFFSQLRRTVEEKMPNRAPPGQIQGILRGSAVKPDEIAWTGLDDFLEAQGGKPVTKQQVLDYLDQNEVRVEEVVKGGPVDKQGALRALDNQNNVWPEGRPNGDPLDREQVLAAPDDARFIAGGTGAKYGQYTLPGGTNYRELLLTLPQKSPTLPEPLTALPEGYGLNRDRMRSGQEWSVTPTNQGHARPFAGTHATPEEATAAALERLNREAQQAAQDASRGNAYRSSHWDEPNVLAHVRFNDRVAPDGTKTLLIEEVQSDWHQAGRKEGYKSDKPTYSVDGANNLYDENGGWTGQHPTREAAIEAARTRGFDVNPHVGRGSDSRVPDAPFKKTWPELAVKRMIRYAAENGYDRIAWPPGAVHAKRYNLAQHVDELFYTTKDGAVGTLTGRKGGRDVVSHDNIPADKLADYVGQEPAARLLSMEPDVTASGDQYYLTGRELATMGGEGMKGFYDQILPTVAQKLGKKFGARVGETLVVTDTGRGIARVVPHPTRADGFALQVDDGRPTSFYRSAEEAQRYADAQNSYLPGQSVHSLDITPAMRESVVKEGQPLFAGVPFDPASAAVGAGAGAASGEDEGDPGRTAAGMAVAGILGGRFPKAAAWYRSAKAKNAARMAAEGIAPASKTDIVRGTTGTIGYGAMLGPATATFNAAAGLTQPAWALVKEPTRAVSRAIGTRNPEALREPVVALDGAMRGMSHIGSALWDVIRAQGKYAPSPDSPNLSQQLADPIGRGLMQALETPGRFWAGAPDAIFGTLAQYTVDARRAAQLATEAGHRGQKWDDWVDLYRKEVERVRTTGAPPHQIGAGTAEAIRAGDEAAEKGAYRQPLGEIGKRVRTIARLGNFPVVGNFVAPFFNSPWNIHLQALERSPVGLAMNTQASKFDKYYDAAVGSAAILGLVELARQGKTTINGSGPTDQNERQAWLDAGNRPYSIQVGDVFIPNRAFSGAEPLLNAAGETMDYLRFPKKDADDRSLTTEALTRVGRLIKQHPYAAGYATIADIAQFGPAAGIADVATRLTPGAATARAIGTAGDTAERTVDRGAGVPILDEAYQRWQQATGQRVDLPVAQNILGEPKENPQQGVAAFFGRLGYAKDDPVIRVFQEARVFPGNPPDDVRGIKLTPDEKRRWDTYRGEALRETIPDVADAVQGESPEVREKALRNAFQSAGRIAQGRLIESMPDFDARLDAALEKKAGTR
jgi:antitoxin (DNA-binding transcriptional repressor) of toxin-antitoxin stability system